MNVCKCALKDYFNEYLCLLGTYTNVAAILNYRASISSEMLLILALNINLRSHRGYDLQQEVILNVPQNK